MGPITRGGETLERKCQCHQNIIIYTGGVQRHPVAHQKRFDNCAGVAVVHAAGGRGDARFIELLIIDTTFLCEVEADLAEPQLIDALQRADGDEQGGDKSCRIRLDAVVVDAKGLQQSEFVGNGTFEKEAGAILSEGAVVHVEHCELLTK